MLVVALLGTALLIRWPYLQTFPNFTDEINEVRYAAGIAVGDAFPLTAKDTYFGPLHAYILAALLKLFGPSVALPRLTIMVFGALAVVATYLLGRELAGRAVGAVAAALLATSPQHILINSHIAWQHSTMPLYSTLCCWAFVRALRALPSPAPASGQREGELIPGRPAVPGTTTTFARYLILAGFLFGLTLQTHPGAVVFIPALAAAFLLALRSGKAWPILRTGSPYGAVLVALVAYGPVLVFNATHGLVGVNRVLNERDYVYETDPSWANYRTNATALALQLLRMVGDPTRLPASLRAYLSSPYLVISAILCLAGLALLARRGRWLPVFLLSSTLLLLPRYLKAYVLAGLYQMALARYVAYLLPFLYIAVAAAAVAAAVAMWRWLEARRSVSPVRPLAAALSAGLIICLVLFPCLQLRQFYVEAGRIDPDNRSFLAMLRELNALRGERTPVLVDSYLDRIALDQGVSAGQVIDYLLTMDSVPHRTVDDPIRELRQLDPLLDLADPATQPLVIMMRDRCWRIRDQVSLQRVGERLRLRELYPDLPSYFAVYRYAPGQAAGCFGAEGPQPGD